MGNVRYAKWVAETFGQLLRAKLRASGLTMRAFAKACDTGISNISRVAAGDRGPSPEWLEPWADQLKLTGDERARFIELGRSARAKRKADSADYINELEDAVRDSVGLLVQIVAVLEKKGQQLPKGIAQQVSVLEDRWL